MGVPLLEGRGFTEHDGPETPAVALVNQAFRDRFMDGADVIGRSVRFLNGDPTKSYEVVGVVGNMKYSAVREADEPIIFVASVQDPDPPPSLQVVVRSTLSSDATSTALAQVLQDISPSLVFTMRPMTRLIEDTMRIERLVASLAVGFGGLALLLAGVGLYGVIAYIAVQREHEIGIRLALGATRFDVVRHVVHDTAILVASGVGVGLAAAVAVSRAVEGLLFGLPARDAVSYAVALAVLLAIGLLASALPAWRAARTSPMRALRQA
jgi:ABC-type antimicrobial peptide transport system permease subunit